MGELVALKGRRQEKGKLGQNVRKNELRVGELETPLHY